ncbi:MAG TPA: VOC family protein [Burkholderiales bacterium]
MDIADRQKPAPGELFLDHVSHFLPDLDAAAAALEKLGFRVTARSDQQVEGKPAGAANRCVMLEQGYIELLAPTHDTPAARRMRARMEKFTGVHLACFGTPDADAEQVRLAAHGFEPEPLVHLERGLARFKVVRPAPDAMPEGRVQYVQQLTPQQIWREENLRHSNGVFALSAVYVVAADVPAVAARWARFAALLPQPGPAWVELRAARGSAIIGSKDFLESCGAFRSPPEPPALAGYALLCRNAAAFAGRCARQGLAVRKLPRQEIYSVALPAALGGTWILI